jgi:excisionase family DNA binding protein
MGVQMQEQLRRSTDGQLLTKGDVARIAQYSKRSVDYWIQTGALPYVKFGRGVRFLASDVQKFIEEHRIGGGHESA